MKKSHWIILAALLLLVAVYFIARSKAPVEKEVRFFKADSAAITRMEFSTPEDTVIVVRQGNEWKLSYPVAWDVNADQLREFFRQVLPIKTSTTPMSEDPNQHQMYKVDAAGAIQVKLYGKGGSLLDHAYIGNGTDTSYDYGRKEGDKNTYQFRNNITNFVRPDIFAWRSTNITNLKRSQIDKIDVTYTKGAYTLTVFADSMRYTDKRESFTIPELNRAQFKVINALENMMTWQFVDKGTEQYAAAFKNPECRIVVHLKDKSVRTFSLVRKITPKAEPEPNAPPNDVLVLMMVDDKLTPLYEMTGDFINRFTRAAQHFKVEFD